ncbi:MAG: sigma-70 family RNA polymerase sigma factor [Planctomycetes bacterium]|nr:sigma-70 family RNA polymerase sigma factor [Planctomycetota bacterium]
MSDPSDITLLLRRFGDGGGAADELLPLVYDSLQRIARSWLRRERDEHTLQATALVHEAYIRLVGGQELEWQHRSHFFQTASEAMRRVLIDHARKHRSQKRGGGRRRVPLSQLDLAADNDYLEVVALDDALSRLEQEDERAARIVKLRYFAGLEVREVAVALAISERTAAREWAFARARLYELMGYDDTDDSQSSG